MFENSDVSEIYTIGDSGINAHTISLPDTTSDSRYDVTVEGLIDSNGEPVILSSKIPTKAGDCSIIKWGVKTLTINPITSTTANFGVIPTKSIVKPTRYYGDNYGNSKQTHETRVLGGNSNKSSTKITLKKGARNIRKDMLLITNGNKVPHNTKVVRVQENLVTLNNAVALDDNTSLIFRNKTQSLVPFSLTIPKGPGKTLYLKSDRDEKRAISGVGNHDSTLTSATTASTTINLANVRGIKSKHMVTGTGVVVDPEYGYLRVESVDHSNNSIVVSSAQTIADETALRFHYPEEDPSLPDVYDEFKGANRNVKLIHVQSTLSDGDLVIEGYLDVHSIQTTETLDIHIDDLVTVN